MASPNPQSVLVGQNNDSAEKATGNPLTAASELVELELVIDPEILAVIRGKAHKNEIPLTLEFATETDLVTAQQLILQLSPALSIRQFPLTPRIFFRIASELLQKIWPALKDLRGLRGIFLEQETIPQWMDAARQINLDPTVWNVQGYKGDPYSSVALIDHGFDASQACFAGKDITWVDFDTTNWPVTNDTEGHGTKVGAVAVGNGWNYTDDQGRTIMSQVTPHAFSGIEPSLTQLYYFVEFSVNVSRPGDLNLTGYWFTSTSSITMKNFSICGPSGGVVATVETPTQSQNYSVVYPVSGNSLGVYTVITKFTVDQSPTSYNISLELRIPQLISENGYNFQGVAPNCKLVALRALTTSETISALYWIQQNYRTYNITSLVMSIILAVPDQTVIRMCNELVSAGIMVVSAAGNSGGGGNYAGSGTIPGSADKSICVGAITQTNRVTDYSSQGGSSYVFYYAGSQANGFTIKPDVVAPGGEFGYNGSVGHPLMVPDANTAEDVPPEKIINDTSGATGTSFSAPAVAGLAQLLIEALGGTQTWSFTEAQALGVKSVICMTATETNQSRIGDITNESDASPYSPSLDRGEKDVQEGYGRINPAAAIQAVTTSCDLEGPAPSAYLWGQNSGPMNATRCWATKVYLNQSYLYNFTLMNPGTGDFDLYLYHPAPSSSGDPIIFKRSINAGVGIDEIISDFAIPTSGNYYLVIKAVSGEGTWTLYANKTLDVVPPTYCWLNRPSSATYFSKSMSFTIIATDGETGIHYQELWGGTSGVDQLLATVIGNGSITWNTITHPDGHYTVKARVFDGNNNTLNSTNTLALIVDNSPPSRAQFLNLQEYGKYGGVIRIWIDTWDALSGVVACALIDEQAGSIGTVSVVGESPYLFVWQTNESMDGTYQLVIVVQDRVGNQFQTEYLTIFIANNELFMFGLYYFVLLIGPIIIIGYFLTRFILLHEGLTRVWNFFKKVRKATEARDWERLTKHIKKPIRSRQKRNN